MSDISRRKMLAGLAVAPVGASRSGVLASATALTMATDPRNLFPMCMSEPTLLGELLRRPSAQRLQ